MVDCEPLIAQSLHDLIPKIPLDNDQIIQRYRGWNLTRVLRDLSGRYGVLIPPKFEPTYRTHLNRMLSREASLFPGVMTFLSRVACPVGIASNAPRSMIAQIIKTAQLQMFSDKNTFSAYEIGAWKPAPDIFLSAAESMGRRPDDCLVVEDSEIGLAGARAAGMSTLHFTPELENPKPDQFNHFDDLPRKLSHLQMQVPLLV